MYLNVKYTGSGLHLYHCPGGIPYYAYEFQFKKGSGTSTPFIYGNMSTNDGRAYALTELHDGSSGPTAYLGCASPSNCDDPDFGIEIQAQSGAWNLCCQSAVPQGPNNPPYIRTFNTYWSFKTCHVTC